MLTGLVQQAREINMYPVASQYVFYLGLGETTDRTPLSWGALCNDEEAQVRLRQGSCSAS
jgi:hypothetical protein